MITEETSPKMLEPASAPVPEDSSNELDGPRKAIEKRLRADFEADLEFLVDYEVLVVRVDLRKEIEDKLRTEFEADLDFAIDAEIDCVNQDTEK
jgi:hypothetical protein